jgi:PucR family transcriptional regulator, purine catabolism regulatory protein
MQLYDVMKESSLGRGKLAAGEEGLKRAVQSVNMMDAPDIESYLKPGQLLLTTGYSLRNKPEQLISLVQHMASVGCAGLGIKSERFLKGLPEKAVLEAEQVGLPLIDIPEDVTLGDLVHDVLALILQSKEAELRESKQFHERLSRLLHQEEGLTLVMRELERKLQTDILLMDGRGQVLYYRYTADEKKVRALRPEQLLELPEQEAEGWVIHPIEAGPGRNGYFYIKGKREFDDLHTLFLSQAANVVSFELLKQQALQQHERMMKNAFFNDVVERQFETNAEILSRGRYYGLEGDTLYLSAVGQIGVEGVTGAGEKEMYEQRNLVQDVLEEELSELFSNYVLFTKGGLFVLLVGIQFYHEEVEQQFADGLADIQTICKRRMQTDISFGIGNGAYQLTDLPKTWQESVEALHAGMQVYNGPFIQSSRTRGMPQLMQMIPEENRRSFVEDCLHPVLSLENGREKQALLQTLESYLASQTHIARTAEALNVHRNTVLFRLKKCGELLNRDLKEETVSLELRLALYLLSLSEK